MIKKATISVLLILIVIFTTIAQTTLISISGHVTNINGGLPVSNHEVFIISDSISNPVYSYFNITTTDVNGYYNDSILIPANSQILFEVFTFDCLNIIHSATVVSNNTTLIADFQICDSVNTYCASFFTAFPDSLDPLMIHFIDLSSPNIDNWYWEFGDGITSTLQNPVHHYPDTGHYTVCLTVSAGIPGTSNYCEDTFCDSIFVLLYLPPCHADFNIVNDPMDPLTFHFLNHSFGNFNDMLWNFGDGNFSHNFSPTHTYLNPGNYTVCLTVFHINPANNDTVCADMQCKQLSIPPVNFYNLAGQVFANFFPVNICDIFLYRIMNNGEVIPVDTTRIDTNGVYFFHQAPAGNYFIKAEPVYNSPLFSQYLPAYFGNSLHWTGAFTVQLISDFFDADINLLPYPFFGGGQGRIKGNISFAGKYSSKGNPAPHIEILLLDMQNKPRKIDYSDHNGFFKFDDLPYGTYLVYAEIAGKNTMPVQVVLDINNPVINDINLIITQSTVFASVKEYISEKIGRISDIYPNPANDLINIDMNMTETSMINMNLFSSSGMLIKTENYYLQNGENKIIFNLLGLENGIYFLQFVEDKVIVSVKKFILNN